MNSNGNKSTKIWQGIINTINKNKGDPAKAKEYKSFTFLRCLRMVFTSVLNTRITKYVGNKNIINSYPAGFRKVYPTSGDTFILQNYTPYINISTKKLFCAYTDLKQNFVKVCSEKLQNVNRKGKYLTIIQNICIITLKHV